MHPIRRRKKRPNYGIRTVEVSRGKNGFGFTISGQQPCILSCIVAGSPAEKAGLRPGDYLVAVNGQSVSKLPHDEVVRLIGCSSGILKLQIAENYYSDSSDEDVIIPARPKPKYMHKPRSGGQHHRPATIGHQSRTNKVVQDLRTGAMFEEQRVEQIAGKTNSLPEQWEPPVPLPLPPPRLYQHPQAEKVHDSDRDRVEYRALVGYLGTIEMPKELQPGSRLQVVRSCIKRLRTEKRAHTLVLMSVHTRSLSLTNCHRVTIAQYPSERVTFCGTSADEERQFFGIITTASGPVEDENDATGELVCSSACHVFAVELQLHGSHSDHATKVEAFKMRCNVDAATGHCCEFPSSSDPIVNAVKVMYSGQEAGPAGGREEEPLVANSPQPSNASSTATTASSNSDSGIGFRDDCGNQSDRILVVDVRNQRLHIQQMVNGNQASSHQPKSSVYDLTRRPDDRLTVRVMPDPVMNLSGALAVSSRSRSPLNSSSDEEEHERYSERAVDVPVYDFSGFRRSHDDMSVSSQDPSAQSANAYNFPGLMKSVKSVDAMSIGSVQSRDAFSPCKLSPKVFGTPARPVTHSLEDLKSVEGVSHNLDPAVASPSSRGQQWGSLQELRSFVANCFESSPSPQDTHEASDPHAELLQDGEPERGVASWANSFEKLLGDPAGLHTFAEFLKKEFSHENIYFWVACEKFRLLGSAAERATAARDIFERHLCLGALEPVNVDSHARQATQEGLADAAPTLFLQAQKQIFNLMKFDSYPRFLKSELYKDCLVRELSGRELPFPGGDDLDTGLQLHNKLKKSRSDAEDRRRKSLLPWHRKNRSKSKDRGESEYNKLRMLQRKRDTDDTVSVRSDMTSSRSSLASWDLALRGSFSRQSVTSAEGESCCTLCRVILPDGATTVVQTRSSECVRDLVLRLLDKRGLHYSAFDVFVDTSVKALSLDEDSAVLAGKEVRVEQRVVFRLDLPNRKTVGVKSRPGKTLAEVLRPILRKYGYKLELITLCLMSENEVVELSASVMSVDNQRLQVLTRNAEAWKNEIWQRKIKAAGPTLDEITNRVFEELLQGKAMTSDQGSVKSEDWGSEHSSGIFGRFLRRDSALLESRMKGGDNSKPPPLIAKWKVGVKLQGRSESDELYEGLKRAQRSRLEDQRGTEINFELPDFLKDKENAPQTGKKFRKLRRADESSIEPPATTSSGPLVTRLLDQSFVAEGVIPTSHQADEYFMGRRHGDEEPGSSCPPPLPPKPKHIAAWSGNAPAFRAPADSTTNSKYMRPSEAKRDGRVSRSRKAVYLDQPSSSFV